MKSTLLRVHAGGTKSAAPEAMIARPSLLALLLLGACSGGSGDAKAPDASPPADATQTDATPTTDANQNAVPRIEAAACRYDFPDLGLSEGSGYDCGDLIVYENRDQPSNTIKIHYARIHSNAVSNNATIYLAGGPGGNGGGILSAIAAVGPDYLQGLLVDGDFLVIGQRGTSVSEPFLDCDNASDCSALSANLPSYNTGYNADDVDDLRATLGYQKLNLYGISYGSRLGLEVLRRHGENVRAAVLGGLVPAQVVWPAGIPASFYSALTTLDASCADAGQCGVAYGNLESHFVAGVADLDSDPLVIDVQGNPVGIDGGLYAYMLFKLFYSKSTYPYLPMLIHDFAERRTDRIDGFVSAVLGSNSSGNISTGLYYSIVCGELFSPPSTTAFDVVNANVPPDIRDMFSGSWFGLLASCEGWPSADFQEGLAQQVTSSVPTLVASGTQDPITPPNYGDITAEGLSSSTVVVYENSGHGATIQTACGNQTLFAFLANPTEALDATCAAGITTDYILPAAMTVWSVSPAAQAMLRFELDNVPLPPDMQKRLDSVMR